MNTALWRSLSISLLAILIIGVIGVKVYIESYLQAYLQREYNQSIQVWKETNKVLPKGGIVFVGDSITQGFNVHEFFHDKPVVNRGIIGDTTDGVLARMNESVYELYPSKVFILIGTNDLGENKKNPEYIASNIEKIVLGIKANNPDAKIYIQSLYPVNRSNHPNIKKSEIADRTNEKIEKINAVIQKLCEENNVTYIDVYSNLLDGNNDLDINYTIEGLHLNVRGYKRVVDILTPYINE